MIFYMGNLADRLISSENCVLFEHLSRNASDIARVNGKKIDYVPFSMYSSKFFHKKIR